MNEKTLGHFIIRFENGGDIFTMDTNSNTHEHVLGGFNQLPFNPLKITFFESFQTKITKIKVAVVFNVFLHLLGNLHNFICNNTSLLEFSHCEMKVVGAHLMNITRNDTSRENFIVGVGCDHSNTNFSRKYVDFLGSDIIIHR